MALLWGKAWVNARTKEGSTALALAVEGRHYDTTRALLAAGADVNARDAAGDTPVIIVSRTEMVVQLGRTNMPGTRTFPSGGRSPSTIVEEVDPGPRMPHVRWDTIRNMEPGLVALLLDAGADPNAKDRDGLTPLMYAAGQGRIELVRLLLARGADVEVKNANGDTAATLATGEEVRRALREARGRR